MRPTSRLLLTSQTHGRGLQVARLREEGGSPRRLLVLAETQTSTVPQGRRGEPFVDALVARMWLHSQQGLTADVLQGARSSLRAIRPSSVTRHLAGVDLVLVLLDGSVPGSSSAARQGLGPLLRLLPDVPATTTVVVVHLEEGDGIESPAVEADGFFGSGAPLWRVRVSRERADSASHLADALLAVALPAIGSEHSVRETVGKSLTERLQQVAEFARASFEASQATIDLVQGDALRRAASAGVDLAVSARGTALSSRTRSEQGCLVLDAPSGAMGPISFYAGRPLRSPDGACIGTLNLYDSASRRSEVFDAAAMHDLAQLAEAELAA